MGVALTFTYCFCLFFYFQPFSNNLLMIPNPSFKMSHTSVTFYKRYQTSDQQKNSKKVLRIGPILITVYT